jgi:hypothetical protein
MTDTPKPRTRAKAAAEPKAAPAAPREDVKKAPVALGERVADTAKRVGKSLQASSQTWVEGNAEIGLKIIDQTEQNVQQAFAAMRAAAKAKDIAEVMKIQAEFVRLQGERSAAQAKQIGDMIVRVGRDSMTPLRPGGATP